MTQKDEFRRSKAWGVKEGKIKRERRKEILKSLKNEGDFNTMFNCYKMIKLNSEI